MKGARDVLGQRREGGLEHPDSLLEFSVFSCDVGVDDGGRGGGRR